MPFHLIQSILATSFACLWLFIGLMLMADKVIEVRRRRMELQGPHTHLREKEQRKKRRERTAQLQSK